MAFHRHAQTVGKDIAALHGDGKGQIGVIRDHCDGIPVKIGRNGRFLADHFIKDLIGDIGLDYIFLRFQQFHRFIHLLGGLGVDGRAHILKGDAERILGVIDHQDVIHVGLTPQRAPAGHDRFILHQPGIVDKPQNAPGIGHRILVAGIVGLVQVDILDVVQVRDVGKVKLLQHSLRDHTGDHIVRGDDDIVAGAAGFQLGVHRFVGIVVGVDHLNAGDLLKGLVDIQRTVGAVGNIFAPVVNADGIALVLIAAVVIHIQRRGIDARPLRQRPDGAEAGESQHQRRQQRKDTLFHSLSSFPIICFSFLAE